MIAILAGIGIGLVCFAAGMMYVNHLIVKSLRR